MSDRKQRAKGQALLNLQPIKAGAVSSTLEAIGRFKGRIQQAAQNAVAVILKNDASDRYFYGQFDNLPNTIIASVDNSGTATACAGRLAEFIEADGFIQEGLDEVKANKKQTLKTLVGEAAANLSYLKGFALRVVFNNAGQIVKIFSEDVKNIRRVKGGFEINPLMGEIGKRDAETFWVPEFDLERDPAERRRLIVNQVNQYGEQKGELVYVFKKGMGRYYDIYPVPDFYSSIEDVIADGKISQLELRNITQGFRTPVIISTGPIDDQTEDEDGKTPQDYFDEQLENFTGEDASPMLHLKGATEDFKPTVTTINIAEILDQTEKASERIAKRVARLFRVPDILIGMAREGQLGNAQELKNQMSLFALTVYRLQDMIKQGFEQIAPLLALPGMERLGEAPDFTLSTLRPFDHLPAEVLNRLNEGEIRELFEIDLEASPENVAPVDPALAISKPEANSNLANLTGRQLQGIQRIVRKYNKEELSYDQAAQLLISGFALTDEQVAVWLVTKEEDQEELDLLNLIKNESYSDYPKQAQENAKIALRWAEENGWGDCGTPVGKARANQLAKGEAISEDTISRMASFERHRQSSEKDLGDGCGRLMWLAWGGDAGIEWAQRKLEQIKKEEK